MLSDLQNEPMLSPNHFQRVEDGGKVVIELHVHDGADHLGDSAWLANALDVGQLAGLVGRWGRRLGMGVGREASR
jgi:hypothetical protein